MLASPKESGNKPHAEQATKTTLQPHAHHDLDSMKIFPKRFQT
jgi:hypothetical protein